MPSTAAVLGIAAVAVALVLTPGPNMLYLVSRSLTQGRRAGLISLAGVGAGFLGYLILATAGVVAVLTLVPTVYVAIKVAGGAYLLWLAWTTLRPGGRSAFEPAAVPRDRPRRLFLMGLVTNLLNPKIAMLYVALLPQFVDPARGSVATQSLILGLIQVTVALTMNGLLVLGAGTVARFLHRRPVWLRAQRYAMGATLTGLALHLFLSPTPRPPALATR
ncbi:lysine transporter LysE [Pilimelia anulata]|uniref:Lysine transporter LysE n=1 Tax=Pilimelia anulata TaxID=53371 RepID=A0A8J3F7C1_9ACTN|nr:LysE family translocator [Pilimelia anulata]GGJ87420.1 lysine transporter LysE [Pilimelia anulata]